MPAMLNPRKADIDALVTAALACFPIPLEGLVVNAEPHPHNPDELDVVAKLFDCDDVPCLLEELEKCASRRSPFKLEASSAPGARVLSGRAFAREYERPDHRTLFLMIPLISRGGNTGLLVVQHEEATRGSGMATDHWILMNKGANGQWSRCPVPQILKDQLFLTEETGG